MAQIRLKIASDELKDAVAIKIQQADIIHKAFLRPFELLLKTNKANGSVSNRSMPQGLMNALKFNSISDNTYEPIKIPIIDPEKSYEKTCNQNADNLISFLKFHCSKREQRGLELAICVCMYSENKTMLKDTIKGIQDNVAKLVLSGINPDSIAVFVIMDGIEKVDESVVNYFDELERESHIYLGEDNVPSYTPQDIEEQLRLKKNNEFSTTDFVQRNMNSFLFSQPELSDRQARRFVIIRNEYLQFKRIKKQLARLQMERKGEKRDQNLFESLPERVRKDFWVPLAREHHGRLMKKKEAIGSEAQELTDQQLIESYAYGAQGRVIATEAINKAIFFIDKYILAREDLCYVGAFRKKIIISSQEKVEPHALIEEEDDLQRHMNLFMCVKYKNAGKLSSHNWFFNGFCKELNPHYTVLMDVGLKPEQSAIYKMYNHMKLHPNVGGVCGYMRLKIQQLEQEEQIKDEEVDWLSSFTLNFVDIQKAQQMEYNLAHIIDKPFQSAFGFIHVLPGAFSGYNMKAFESDKQDTKGALLQKYFKSIQQKLVQSTINPTDLTLISVFLRILLPEFLFNFFWGVQAQSQEEMLYNENIYFAEDRILCMEIHKQGLDLIYLPDALAQVDPIKTVHGLMGQRKRWINGSYFAFQKVKKQLKQTKKCELLIKIQVLFYDFINIIIYFVPALFFFTIHISMSAFKADVLVQIVKPIQASQKTNEQFFNFFVFTIDLIYALTLGAVLYYSLNTTANKPLSKPYIYLTSTILGILSIAVLAVFLVDTIRGLLSGSMFLIEQGNRGQSDTFKTLLMVNRWIVVGVFGIYFVPLLVYGLLFRSMRPLFQAVKNAFSLIFYNPTYFIILNFYALCRIDDISWGTKGLDQQGSVKSKIKEKWRLIKLVHVSKYVIWNVVGSALLLSFSELNDPRFYISFVIMILVVSTIGLKIIIGTFYLFFYRFRSCCLSGQTSGKQVQQSSLRNFAENYKKSIVYDDAMKKVNEITGQIHSERERRNGGSFILGLRSFVTNPNLNRKAIKLFQKQNDNRSKVMRQLKEKRSNRLRGTKE